MAEDTQILLCDLQAEVVDAWKAQFDEAPAVKILQGDIFEVAADVLVLPGNSFGFLDRGLELKVSERFGLELQDRLRETIRTRFHGELLVGQAIFVPLSAPFRELLYAPIVRTPQSVETTVNAFLAARGAFLALRERAEAGQAPAGAVFPGLGTGATGLHPLISARQLRYAYEIYVGARGLGDKNLSSLVRRERKLKSLPRSALQDQD